MGECRAARKQQISKMPRSISTLRQRISVAVKRGNAACIKGTVQANCVTEKHCQMYTFLHCNLVLCCMNNIIIGAEQ